MDTPPPSIAGIAPAPKPFSALLAANADVVALAFSALTFFIASRTNPDASCAAGHVAGTNAIFDACAVLSPLALVAAAFAAVACRRQVSSKIACFFLYGGAAVPVFIGLAQAGSPCTFS